MNRAYPISQVLPNNIHAVSVEFMRGNSRPYTYLSLFPVEAGELLIVEVGDDRTLTLATSVDSSHKTTVPADDPIYYKWVVCRVNKRNVYEYQTRLHKCESACYRAFEKNSSPSPSLLKLMVDEIRKFFAVK